MSKRSCCVPHCGQKKTENVSMHEFPTNVHLSKIWCKKIFNISGFRFGNAIYVCSKHFSKECYIQNSKRLKPNAVPTIFCSNQSPISNSSPSADFSVIGQFISEKNTSVECTEIGINKNYIPTFNKEAEEKPWRYASGDELLHTSQSNESSLPDNAFHHCNQQFNLLDEIINLKRQLQQLNKNHAELKKKHKEALKNIDELKKAHDAKTFTCNKKIETDASKGRPLAIFILDQIFNYAAKKPRWSETSIRHCISWRFSSPKGYEHARRIGIIKVPAKITLKRYLENMRNGSGTTELIVQRHTQEAQSLNDVERIPSLIVDDMAIKERLSYRSTYTNNYS